MLLSGSLINLLNEKDHSPIVSNQIVQPVYDHLKLVKMSNIMCLIKRLNFKGNTLG